MPLHKDRPLSEDSDQSDEVLLRQYIKQHDESALKTLIERHSSLVMSVCQQVLRNQHDAEEAFQETFLKLVNKAESIQDQRALSSWLYQVAYREAINLMRQNQRNKSESMQEEQSVPAQPTSSPEFDELVLLHEELNDLPDKYRAPIVLCYLEGKTRQEAALQLQVTLESLKTSLKQGRNQLQQRLLKRGVAIGAVLTAWQTAQVSAGTWASASVVEQTLAGCLVKSSIAEMKTGTVSEGTKWSLFVGAKQWMTGLVTIALLTGVGVYLTNFKQPPNTSQINSSRSTPSPPINQAENKGALPSLEEILARQYERSELIRNYEVHMKTSYYKNLSIIQELDDLSESDSAPYQTEFIEETVRWEGNKYFADRALPRKGGEYKNLRTSYNGEYTLSDVPVDDSSKVKAVYSQGGSPTSLWGDANSYPMFFFLNFKLFEQNKIKFKDSNFKVRGWEKFNGEKCVVVHQDQESPSFQGSSVEIYWFSADDEYRPVKAEIRAAAANDSKSEYGLLVVAWEIKYQSRKHKNISLPDSWHAEWYHYGKLLSSRTTKDIRLEINKEFSKVDFQIQLNQPIKVREYISSSRRIERTLNPDGTLEPIVPLHAVSKSKTNPFSVTQDNVSYVTLLSTFIVILIVVSIHHIKKKLS